MFTPSPLPSVNIHASGITRFNPYAIELFESAQGVARRRALLALARRQSRQLPVLDEPFATAHAAQNSQRSVLLSQIKGSVNRTGDFDRDFYPLQNSLRNRWARVASLMLDGAALPPIELIQVGDSYYVVDGHHRISVSRMLGLTSIDAVIVRVYEA